MRVLHHPYYFYNNLKNNGFLMYDRYCNAVQAR